MSRLPDLIVTDPRRATEFQRALERELDKLRQPHGKGYEVQNLATPVTVLDTTGATLDDVRQVLGTLLTHMLATGKLSP